VNLEYLFSTKILYHKVAQVSCVKSLMHVQCVHASFFYKKRCTTNMAEGWLWAGAVPLFTMGIEMRQFTWFCQHRKDI